MSKHTFYSNLAKNFHQKLKTLRDALKAETKKA